MTAIYKWLAGIASAVIATVVAAYITSELISSDSNRPENVVSETAPVAPKAPRIEIEKGVVTWEERTMQFSLEPGKSKTLKGMELYSEASAYPSTSCAGPGFVPYTWRIRVPHQGGDLEVRAQVPHAGGNITEVVGEGSVGSGTLGWCDEHTFKNNGVDAIQVEVRYISAADEQ
jgi:hypothetical protein